MAKTSSARKAHRVGGRRRAFNVRRKSAMKDRVKEIGKFIKAKNTRDTLMTLPLLQKAVDKAAKNGTIKKNTAARMKSRIAKRIAALTK